MLFNPQWNKKPTKPTRNWKSLDRLIAWLETKPSDETYRYTDPTHCLLAKYLKAQGKRGVFVSRFHVTFKESFFGWRKSTELPQGFDDIASYDIVADFTYGYRTFGGALKAAKEYRKSKLLENLLLAA